MTTELAAADDLWLGLYQNETGQGPAMGWGRCIAGDAPSFTNWHEGQPDDFGGYQQDCSWLEAATGQWRSLACDGGVHFDPRPWVRTVELSCLCVHGNASVAFADDRKALEAASGYNQRPLTRLTAISYSVATAIALLPSLLLLGRTGWRRLHRGAGAEPGAGIQGATISPSLPARGSTLSTLLSAASSAAVKGVLRAARASAAGRRLRVSFAMGQAGWALLAICLTPVIMFLTAQSIEAAVGDSILWLVPALPSGCLLLLALFPTDVRAIRVVCASLLVLFTGVRSALHHRNPRRILASCTWRPVCCAVVRRRRRARPHAALPRRWRHAAPPRPAAAVDRVPPTLPGPWRALRWAQHRRLRRPARSGSQRHPPPVCRPPHAPQPRPHPPPPGAPGQARHRGGGGGGDRGARRRQRSRRGARTRRDAPPLPARQPAARLGPRRQNGCATSRADAPRAHGAGGDGGSDRLSEPLVE